jgi:PAS domain S-box-containing protein
MPVTPLIAALYMASAASFAVALLAGTVWLVRRDQSSYGWFGLAAMAAGAATFTEPLFYTADTIEAFVGALRWQVLFLAVFLGCFTWFLMKYAGVESRRLGYLILTVVVVLALLNLTSPTTLLYSSITGLRSISLPWGESIVFAEGTPPRYWPLINLPGLLISILVVIGVRRLWRSQAHQRAVALSLAFVPFAVTFWIIAPLSELGVIHAPYLYSFAYLAVVMLIAYELASDVARAATLAADVKAGERRWRALLDNVELFVTEVDREGSIRYVNPYYTRVTGWAPDDVVGRRFTEIVPEADRSELQARFNENLITENGTPTEVSFVTRDDRIRDAIWASVPLLNSAGELMGVLSVGSDVTERRKAESARDKATRELEEFKRQLEEENLFLRQELETSHGYSDIVGESDALRYVLHRVEQVANTDATVLIEGETGVGKELVARAIHRRSSRSNRPFITVDCGTLPANLIENELFGHEKGAFTGATGLHKGRFELADRGTIFLDEIGELPLDLQVKLLRVLETGEFSRVGASRSRSVDVRVIAATNRHLEAEVEEGRLREDLFYRVHVYPITVPPLRVRREDIPLLVHSFVRRLAARLGKAIDTVPGPTMRRLTEYSWPGNVRELENVLERAVILSNGSALSLPPGFGALQPANSGPIQTDPHVSLDELERKHIGNVLESTEWKIEGEDGAAARLGLKPSTLRSRMKKHGIRRTS